MSILWGQKVSGIYMYMYMYNIEVCNVNFLAILPHNRKAQLYVFYPFFPRVGHQTSAVDALWLACTRESIVLSKKFVA